MTTDDKGDALHAFEMSHDKVRLIGPRPSALGTVPTAEQRSRDHATDGTFTRGNQAALGRSARTALRAPYRQAEQRVSEALASAGTPNEADRLLTDALAVFHAARRELGSGSAFVQGPTIAYAVETILAGYFVSEAAKAGFLTEAGMVLHDRALACEQAAARAMTAALAATKALGRRRPGKTRVPSYLEAEGEATE